MIGATFLGQFFMDVPADTTPTNTPSVFDGTAFLFLRRRKRILKGL